MTEWTQCKEYRRTLFIELLISVHSYLALNRGHYTEENMENFLNILIPAALCLGFLRLCFVQVKWVWKLAINSLCGFLCLWLLNLISGFTGILFPINFITASIAGFLGIPGIVFLIIAQLII